MNSQTIFFSANIRFLRERRKMNQQDLAEKLLLTRSKLNALENGHTKAPQPEDYVKFSDFFKISVDSLLRVNLSKLSELHIRQLEAGNDIYMTGSNTRILAITVNAENKENVEYVPIKAKAGYRAGYADPQYLASLPKFNIPNLPSGYTYRMFPTSGDSMLPIPEGSDILARYVQDWKNLKPATLCIVILIGDQDFVFKQVTIEEAGILLHSLNKLYEDYWVEFSEVLEIWEYYSFHSRHLPEAASDLTYVIKEIRKLEHKIILKANKRE